MGIGARLREIRLAASLTQEELADRCELTKGFISQLENDHTSPSIATLEDILQALGTDIREFFSAAKKEEKVVFKKNDYFVKNAGEYNITWLVTNSQKNEMEPILLELEPGGSVELDMPHEGEEFGYVVKGRVTLKLGAKSYKLESGDTFYYAAEKTHCLTNNHSSAKAVIIWVSSPPNF